MFNYRNVFFDGSLHSSVVGRHVFYNNSAFDERDAAANEGDDAAIDRAKQALMPGAKASFANYTSYSRGINGIMIDIWNLAADPTVEDFAFRVGNSNDPSQWHRAPAPASITVRPGEADAGRCAACWKRGFLNALQPAAARFVKHFRR